MTRFEAIRIISDYYYNDNPTDEDKFLFVEAQLFLIHTYHNPEDMYNLAWFYLEERRFEDQMGIRSVRPVIFRRSLAH